MKVFGALSKFLLIFLLIPFLLNSCYAPGVFPIQTLKPAKLNFPDSLSSIGILNASLIESRYYNEEDSTLLENKGQYLNNLSSTELCISLAENLRLSTKFSRQDSVPVLELPPFSFLDTIPVPFSPEEILDIAPDFQSDLIITLEFFEIKSLNGPQTNVIYNNTRPPVVYFSRDGYTMQQHRKKVDALIRIYNSRTGFVTNEYLYRDTIKWITSTSFLTPGTEIQQEDVNIYGQTGTLLGEKISMLLSPSWVEEEREFYYGTKSVFSRAYFLALENNWQSVQLLMKSISGHKNKKVAAYGFFNLAVSLEMQGKLIEACQALENAAKLNTGPNLVPYKKILEKRLKEKELLDIQLSH